jgi:hypothetical protein
VLNKQGAIVCRGLILCDLTIISRAFRISVNPSVEMTKKENQQQIKNQGERGRRWTRKRYEDDFEAEF